MAQIKNPDSQLTAVKWRFPSVHPEGRKYVLIAGGVTLLTYLAISHFLGWLLVGVTIWVATFRSFPDTCSRWSNEYRAKYPRSERAIIGARPSPMGDAKTYVPSSRLLSGPNIGYQTV